MFKRFTMFQEKLIKGIQLSLENVFRFSEKRKFLQLSWQKKIGYQERNKKMKLSTGFYLT